MRKLLPLLVCFAFITSCKWFGGGGHKTFKQTYGTGVFNEINSILPTKDGGYIIAGYTIEQNDPNEKDMPYALYMLKIDASGQQVWDKKWKLSDFDEGMDVKPTSDGNYIISGQTHSGNGDMDILLVKMNEKGDTLWTKSLGTDDGDEVGNAVLQTTDGGYLVAGATGLFAINDAELPKDIFVVKTNKNGEPEWNKVISDKGQESAEDIKPTADGFIIAGTNSSAGAGKEDMFLIRIKANGDTLWTHNYGGPASDFASSVLVVPGGYLLAGTTKDQNGNQDILVIKTDNTGNVVWQKILGGKDPEDIGSIAAVPGGGYVVAGSTYNAANAGNKFYLARLTEKGDTLWTRSYAADKNETAHCVAVTPDKGFILGGVQDGENRSYMYVMKVDENGNF